MFEKFLDETTTIPTPETVKTAIDMVNHPPHYKSNSGLEAIDAIDAFTEDLVGKEAVYTGHIIRYVSRWKKKNGLEDLKKAHFYLNRLINYVETQEKREFDEATKRLYYLQSKEKHELDDYKKVKNS